MGCMYDREGGREASRMILHCCHTNEVGCTFYIKIKKSRVIAVKIFGSLSVSNSMFHKRDVYMCVLVILWSYISDKLHIWTCFHP